MNEIKVFHRKLYFFVFYSILTSPEESEEMNKNHHSVGDCLNH